MAKDDKPAVKNGVNVEALFGAQEALKNAREAAKFERASELQLDRPPAGSG